MVARGQRFRVPRGGRGIEDHQVGGFVLRFTEATTDIEGHGRREGEEVGARVRIRGVERMGGVARLLAGQPV